MADVIGIGASVYDTLMLSAAFPQEDSKLQATQTMIQGGGPCATALVAASRLGVSAEYLGTMGDDPYGQYMLQDFAKYGVETRRIVLKPGCTSFHSFVLLNTARSTRTCVWNKGTLPAPMPVEIDLDAIAQAKVLHLDGHHLEAAIHAARFARAHGVKVSLDAGGTYPGIERLLPFVDFLIASEEFARKLTAQSDAETAAAMLRAQYKPQVLAVTQGSRGCLLWQDGGLRRIPAFPVDVVDSCGAGDVFHGAFVAGYLRGCGDFAACAEFASAVSAMKCTHFGARDGVPSYEDAQAFLRQRKSLQV